MSSADRALELFAAQYNCAQSVLGALGESQGESLAVCLKVASPFGGGICRRAETCGAVTGALMAIGMREGAQTVSDPSKKAAIYERGQEFIARFQSKNGSIICRDLLGCDISTEEGLRESRERNLHAARCTGFLRDAVEIVEGATG